MVKINKINRCRRFLYIHVEVASLCSQLPVRVRSSLRFKNSSMGSNQECHQQTQKIRGSHASQSSIPSQGIGNIKKQNYLWRVRYSLPRSPVEGSILVEVQELEPRVEHECYPKVQAIAGSTPHKVYFHVKVQFLRQSL